MLTLQDALESQNDLESLCADRPLRTREAFAPNAYYGIDRILKQYAGLARTRSLKAVVPHGVVLDENYIWEAEKKALVPIILCYPPYREREYLNQTDKRVFLSASPFLYVVEMLKGQPQPARRGTIFFPHHSTRHVTAQMDFERLAEELTHLDPEYQPVTVCIYWRNFNLGHHLPFQKRGMRIVSAGHMYDPDFLFRFYHLCSVHRYASGNSLGSHLFYSVKAGCSYFHFDGMKSHIVADDHILKRDLSKTPASTELALKGLWGGRQPSATAEQLSKADYYLGADYLQSPAELRKQLLRAELLDKVGIIWHNRRNVTGLVAPTYYRRTARLLKRRLLATGHWLSRSRTSGAGTQ